MGNLPIYQRDTPGTPSVASNGKQQKYILFGTIP
jgi:hypothetical protein